jgi:uncharacterized membrane protein
LKREASHPVPVPEPMPKPVRRGRTPRPTLLQSLVKYFVRGLIVLAPIALTAYVAWIVFSAIDGWINPLLERRIPGAGLLVTLAVIILTGFLASNVATKWLFVAADRAFGQLPVVKLLYTSLKDLVGAFVGDRKKFDRPVRFRPTPDSNVTLMGFLTREALPELGLADHVAVYVPMAFNVGGYMMIVPAARIEPVPLDGATAMTFALSGGVSQQAEPTASGSGEG